MKKIRPLVFIFVFILSGFAIVNGQTGAVGGYGQAYGAAGKAKATKKLQGSMKKTMQNSMNRIASRRAKKKAPSGAKTGPATPTSSTASKNRVKSESLIEPPRNYALFRPDPSVNTAQELADMLGSTADEKVLIKTIYEATMTAYQEEVVPKGWQNNYAGALTFFIATAATVYHDSEEPSDEAVEDLYFSLNEVFDENPEFAEIPNREKQEFHNILVGFSGIVLAGYIEGKQNGNEETAESFRQIAGQLIEIVLQTSPDNVSFESGSFEIK